MSTTPPRYTRDDTMRVRGHYATACRMHGKDSDKARAIRAELTEVQIGRYVADQIAKAPPLNDEQRGRLTALLGGAPVTSPAEAAAS